MSYLQYMSFEDISDNDKCKFQDFVKETYKRNSIRTIPNILNIGFGNASEPYNLIKLDDGVELFHDISWADKENDKKLKRRI